MFSLSTAMILGKESNESNFKALLTQLTGLNLSQTVEKPQEEHPHFSPKISMGTMGGKNNYIFKLIFVDII